MPEILDILIVENDRTDIQSYLDTIKTINKEFVDRYVIVPRIAETKEDGIAALDENSWAAAFIDLKLSIGDILNAEEGNDVIREIYHKRRFPIYILTNTPSDVSAEFKESIFLRVSSKDNIDYFDVFSQIIKVYQTGIINILGRKGLIEKMLDDIFWKNISRSLNEWFLDENSEKQLLRYTLSYLQEYLEMSDDGVFDIYYPFETYINPSNKKYPYTGDILKCKNDGSFWVILTPACDLATDGKRSFPKAKFVTLAKIHSYERVVSGRGEEDIGKLKANNLDLKYHYLPKTLLFGGGFINFQHIISIPIKVLIEASDFSMECVISGSFRKDIISRFANYFSRQGQPSFS